MTVPFASGSATSEAAAVSMNEQAPADKEIVYRSVRAAGASGLTCDEVEAHLGLRHQTASARLNDLVRSGRVIPSCRTRPTRSGRRAFVYVAIELLCAGDQLLLVGLRATGS